MEGSYSYGLITLETVTLKSLTSRQSVFDYSRAILFCKNTEDFVIQHTP